MAPILLNYRLWHSDDERCSPEAYFGCRLPLAIESPFFVCHVEFIRLKQNKNHCTFILYLKKKYFWQFYLELENTRFNIENIPDVLLTHSQRNITISYISNTLTLTASRVLKRIVHCTISLLQFCLKEGPLHVCFTPILLNTVRCLLSWREQSLRDRRLFSPRTLSSNPKFPITKMDYMRSHWRVASWPD